MANPLSPLVDDTGSVYETEGSSVGRTILGTEATTTIAQVIMKDGENLDQVFKEKVLSVILILKPRSSSLPLRHSSSLPSTSSSSSQVGQKTSGNKFIRRNLSSQIMSIIFRPGQDFPSRRASDCEARGLEQVCPGRFFPSKVDNPGTGGRESRRTERLLRARVPRQEST